MIYVEMHGRLGNQMFQYAAARALQEKNNQPIMLSFRKVIGANTEGTAGWENSLKYFNIKPCEYYTGKKSLVTEYPVEYRLLCYAYALSYKPLMNNMNRWYEYQVKCCSFLDRFGIRWIANGYYDFHYNGLKNYLLNGAFESPKYFDSIRDKLLEEFTPREEERKENERLYEQIRKRNSVCLSVRHFQLTGKQADMYDVCSLEYYQTAIRKMCELIKNPLFVVFSDDIEWVKKTIDLSRVEVVYETAGNPVWEKLRLMYSCKNFIIPNSTFAWWAQYLSRNPNKYVLCPAKWFNNNFESPLIASQWVRIDREGNIVNE